MEVQPVQPVQPADYGAAAPTAAAAAVPHAAPPRSSRTEEGRQLVSVGGELARVYVDGCLKHGWRFALSELPDGHMIAVARGPPADALDEWGGFRNGFHMPVLPEGQMRSRLASPPPGFRSLEIADLVPPAARADYAHAISDAAVFAEYETPRYTGIGCSGQAYEQAPWLPGAKQPEKAAAADATPEWFNPANASSGAVTDPLTGISSTGSGDDCVIS